MRLTNIQSTSKGSLNESREGLQGYVIGIFAVGAALMAYSNTFGVPFVYDDRVSIIANSSIRHWGTALFPPSGTTTSGRPILNLTLAVNYAVSGENVWSYHLLNLLIHTLASLTVFGITRRTITQLKGTDAGPIAFATALLWALHPLQTESVTYVVQRAESLMGLFYLQTLYGFIRGAGIDTTRRTAWYTLSITSCILGMATKEVMVSAPLIVLLYDRAFIAGSFEEAWRCRWKLYVGLSATWIILGVLVFTTHGRSGTAGLGSGVTWWSYAMSQFSTITHYLRLIFWPIPLVFDYGADVPPLSFNEAPKIVFITALSATTLWALIRRPGLGFVGAAFFLILAPSSSVLPIATETMAEHRMYLPLLPVLILLILGIHRWVERIAQLLCLILAGLCGILTWLRNEDYQSALILWKETVTNYPSNPRAHSGLGCELMKIPGKLDEAIEQFEIALKLDPVFAEFHNNLGVALEKYPERLPEALQQYKEAARLDPDNVEAHINLGRSLLKTPDHISEALTHLEEAIRLRPEDAEAHYNLGLALAKVTGRFPEAIIQVQDAIRLNPDIPEAHNALGALLVQVAGRLHDAIMHYECALQLQPNYAEAHNNLGNALMLIPNHTVEAKHQYEEALKYNPSFSVAHFNFANLLNGEGKAQEAIVHYQEAVRLDPNYFEAQSNLGLVLMSLPGRSNEAISHYYEALRINPESPVVLLNLSVALVKTPGRAKEAIPHLERLLEQQPGNEPARNALEWIRNTRGN